MKWHLETRKISDLKDHPKNPRSLTKEQASQLQKSIEKFGLIDKPIITKDNLIIGGHQRKNILKKSGFKEVECWVSDQELSEKDIEELNIRLNKNTGDWDWDKLANEWNSEDLIEWGFNSEEMLGTSVEEILGQEEDESQVLEPCKDEDAITKLGDVYELGSHRLVCGDSTLPDVVERCLNENTPILMVTDPPYGVSYDPKWRNEVKGAHKPIRAGGKVQNDDQFDWSVAYYLFPGSVAYIWHAGKYSAEVANHLKNCDYEIISQIIWAKQHFALSRGDYHWQHEPCWYAVKKGRQHQWQGSRKESTLWDISNLNAFGGEKDEERTSHGTQKPLECMARPIRNNTAEGEGVYDPFLGSGTTLIAAESLNRICYGIELSPAYCDIIVNRWVKYMQKNNKPFKIKRNGEDFEWPMEIQSQ